MSNPVVRSITLKGTGPARRSGSINFIRGSLWRGADFYMGTELSEGHITIRDMKTLASVGSMERLTFQNIFFHRRGCASCGNMDKGNFNKPSVRQLILSDTTHSYHPTSEVVIMKNLYKWCCLERVTIHDSRDPILWKVVAPQIEKLQQEHKSDVPFDLSNVWLIVTLGQYGSLRKARNKGIIHIQHIFLRISQDEFRAIFSWRQPNIHNNEGCNKATCWWKRVTSHRPPDWEQDQHGNYRQVIPPAEKSIGMKLFHVMHCGDILELANSCVQGVPGSNKEFQRAKVVHYWEICHYFFWDMEICFKHEEFGDMDDIESGTDLWLEIGF